MQTQTDAQDKPIVIPAEFAYRKKNLLYVMEIERLGGLRERKITVKTFQSSAALTEYLRGSRMLMTRSYNFFANQ